MSNDILDDFNEDKKDEKLYLKRFLNIMFYVAFLFVTFGLMFKIMHWPYSNLMLMAGIGSVLVWFVIYLYSKYIK